MREELDAIAQGNTDQLIAKRKREKEERVEEILKKRE